MTEIETPPPPPATRWIGDVANAEVIRFGIWATLLLAVVVASNAVIVREAEARAPSHLSSHYVALWGVACGGSLLFLSLLGGLLVFRGETKWEVATTWPFLGGILVGMGSFVTVSAMGQTDPGSVSCTGTQPCDTAFGLGAALLSVAAAIPIGGLFIGAYGLKRLAAHPRRRLR
jgi:hypothetical protein